MGLISYNDTTNGDLKAAHCDDVACSSATISTIDDGGADRVGLDTSITIGTDGLGLISYLDFTNEDLKVAHCDNIACTDATTTTIESTGTIVLVTSITIGIDELVLRHACYDVSEHPHPSLPPLRQGKGLYPLPFRNEGELERGRSYPSRHC